MKPLVLWCRWHDARLRIMGRGAGAIWGELVFPDNSTPFRFLLDDQILILGEGPDARTVRLDEMGVELNEGG